VHEADPSPWEPSSGANLAVRVHTISDAAGRHDIRDLRRWTLLASRWGPLASLKIGRFGGSIPPLATFPGSTNLSGVVALMLRVSAVG